MSQRAHLNVDEMRSRLRIVLQQHGPQSQQALLDKSGLDVSQPTMSRLLRHETFNQRLTQAKLYYAKGLNPPTTHEAIINYTLWAVAGIASAKPSTKALIALKQALLRIVDQIDIVLFQESDQASD